MPGALFSELTGWSHQTGPGTNRTQIRLLQTYTETLIYWISYSCEYLIYLRRTNFGKSKRKYERFCMWKVSFFIGLGEKAIIDSGFTIIYSCKKKLNIYQKTEPRSVPIFEPDFWNRFRLRKNQIKNRSSACPIGHTLICKESKTSNVLLPWKCVIEDS